MNAGRISARLGRVHRPAQNRRKNLMSNQWISRLRKRLDDNRRYRRAMAEISALTTRDLVDMRGSREEMHRHIYEEIYGRETAEVHHFNFGEALRRFKSSFRSEERRV